MAGNWKMNLNHVEAVGLLQKLAWTLEDKKHNPDKSEVIVLPPFTDLRTIQTLVDGDRLEIGYGAQDVSAFDAGAYTGDISADMLVKLGCRYVVVGHSERRRFHGEDDNIVNAKTLKAVSRGIAPIVCVGERLAVRQQLRQVPDTLHHVEGALAGLTPEQIGKLVIAYEPVWAIGTGRVATPQDAQEVCAAVRNWVRERHGSEIADEIRILYGGSVNATNVAALMGQPDIDGCLVGAASLKVDEFAAIARFYEMPM
ncbi:MAG TPA: triose-phosphate isomerase, partial [Propionibacteriaceae bacterium]|nr:triose-phosphate isomerase [Propionibacteriaceae bacterium]